MHTLQLPRERIRRIEWQMAVRNEELLSPATSRRQHSALKEDKVEKYFEAIRQRRAIWRSFKLINSDLCYPCVLNIVTAQAAQHCTKAASITGHET